MAANDDKQITPSAESVKAPSVKVKIQRLTPQQLIEQMKHEGVSNSNAIGRAIADLYSGIGDLASKATGVVAEGVAAIGGPLVYAVDALLRGLDGMITFDPERYISTQLGMLEANAKMRDKLKAMVDKAKTDFKPR